METSLVINAEEYGLESKQVESIEVAFASSIGEREALTEMYNDVIVLELTPENCDRANDIRKMLVKVRTGIAGIHKTQKAFYWSAGKYVDAWKNKETEPIVQMEAKLKEMADYIELQEKARLALLQSEREEKLVAYFPEAREVDLSTMDEDVFQAYFDTKKKNHLAIAEANLKAEEARIAEEEKAEKERIAQLEKDRIAREKVEKENEALRVQAKKDQAKIDKLAEAQRVADKKEVDRIAKENADIQAKLNRGDEGNLQSLVIDLKDLKTKYNFKSAKSKKMHSEFCGLIDKVIGHINK